MAIHCTSVDKTDKVFEDMNRITDDGVFRENVCGNWKPKLLSHKLLFVETTRNP